MSLTPFIRPIKLEGGTFYTCISVKEDLNYTLDNTSKYGFRFSNFALLNIPPLKKLTGDNKYFSSDEQKPNYIQLESILGANRDWINNDGIKQNTQTNKALCESFQNYFYNLETIITNDDSYEIDEKRTTSERIFFKWLKEIGAIRFELAKNEVVLPEAGFGDRFIEEKEKLNQNGEPIYNRVVKYIGNINVINQVKNIKNSFTEIYIHIPLTHGSTKDVLFNSISDNNYKPNKIFQTKNVGLSKDYIEGRKHIDFHPYDSNISIRSYTDEKNGFERCWFFDLESDKFIRNDEEGFKWWFSDVGEDSYYLEPDAFGNVLNEIYAISYKDEDPNIETNTNITKFIRNKLDGISIEFNPNLYSKIAYNNQINSIAEYNASQHADNFSFNTILVYYDVYDNENPSNFSTNLFGVLFLDDVEYVESMGGVIKSYNKYKPNSILQQNGNSYAFRLNLKIDPNSEDSVSEVNINDYNTFSLELYIEALSKMKVMTDRLEDNLNNYKNLQEEVEKLKSLYLTSNNLDDIEKRIEKIETNIKDSQTIFLNNKSLVELINKNYREITNIYKNYTSIEMTYNIDGFRQGNGIEIDKSKSPLIFFNNIRQNFNISNKPIISINNDFETNPDNFSYTHILNEFDNYLRISDGSFQNPFILDRDVLIYIDDTSINWKKGQRLRVSFTNGLNMNNVNGIFNLIIYSDSQDLLNTGYNYSAQISYNTHSSFNEENRFKPIIELICIDIKTFTFITDVF